MALLVFRVCLGVGVVLDGDAQHERFGPGVEACIARPTPSVAAPKTQLSFSRAWLATACPSPAAAGSTPGPGQARPLTMCTWAGAETPQPFPGEVHTSPQPVIHRLWATTHLFPWDAAFNASRYKQRDLEILVWLLSCHDGAHGRRTSCYNLAWTT